MAVEVSVVMPCLNEEETIGICIDKTRQAFEKHNIDGEAVVADNGSTDNSVKIAISKGAKVVYQPERGYGSAYQKGIEEANGKYIIIGDSDDTYDFSELGRFVELLRRGYELVMGTRLKGKILPGAMPWSHRYIGNPILTGILNLFFHTGVSDAYCGMRGFTKEAYKRMQIRTTGMEFALEMVIRASKIRLKITEIPITYYPRKGKSKLRSFSDAWRTIRFMLLYCPFYLFLLPGFSLFSFGMLLLFLLLPGPFFLFGHGFDVHMMVFGTLCAILGFQIITLGLYAKTYAVTSGLDESNRTLETFWRYFNLEKGLLLGFTVFFAGFAMNFYILSKWIAGGFGELRAVRPIVFASTLMVIGAQVFFSSFFLSILGVKKKS
ncbi:MAG: glycosyltransferase family 2 protein [Candidatus Edwardsbacteria bacterium]